MADTSASSEILLSAGIATWLLLQVRCAAGAGLTRLAKCARRRQFADSRFVVAEDVFKHVLIVLTETRRGAVDDARRAREFRARTLDGEFTEAGMIERDEVRAMLELWIGECVGAVLYLMRGNAVRLQARFDCAAIE